ncbi:MAG: hypothetical protein PHD88_00030 [Firmicutes bacterium]|nr:hypothetical protein [Bacillota bacterium]
MKYVIVVCCFLLLAQVRVGAADFLIDDFSDVSDWSGDFQVVDKQLVLSGEATKEVLQDWSGYQSLEIVRGNDSHIKINILDAEGEIWTAKSQGLNFLIPFEEFTLEKSTPTGDMVLSAGNIHKLTVIGSAELKSIGLSGSKGFSGPNVYIQTANKYFAGKSWDKVASEVKSKGFTAVHLTPVELTPSTYYKQKEIVEAFHQVGLPVALAIYPGTDFYAYDTYPMWHQSFLEGGGSSWSWRVYNCLREEAFIDYTIKYLQKQFLEYGYDALHISEPWLEVWGGPQKPELYACFCERCKSAFKTETGVDPVELFTATSLNYYTKNPQLYQKWMDFRVDTVVNFVEKIIDGLHQVKPGVPAYVMFLSDITVEPGKTREYQAMDLERFAEIGDAVIIETAWQDWTKSDLWPGYILSYGMEYSPRVFAKNPEALIFAQPDVGSNWDQMHRSPKWLREFSAFSNRSGFDGYIVYEYSQMGYRMLPSTEIVLDDFEKSESGDFWSAVKTGYDEVLVGRMGNNSFEGEGSLLLYYSGVESGTVGMEKDVMLDLTGFEYLELTANFATFNEGDKITLRYEIVTGTENYTADCEVTVLDKWQVVNLPFSEFGDDLNLSQVKKIRISLIKTPSLDPFGMLYIDLLKAGGSRRSFIDGQSLPLTRSPKQATNVLVENIKVELLETVALENNLHQVDLKLTLLSGERSIGNLVADVVVCDQSTMAELPKLNRSYKLGALRKGTDREILAKLTLPKGEFEISVRLYTQGTDFLSQKSQVTKSDSLQLIL